MRPGELVSGFPKKIVRGASIGVLATAVALGLGGDQSVVAQTPTIEQPSQVNDWVNLKKQALTVLGSFSHGDIYNGTSEITDLIRFDDPRHFPPKTAVSLDLESWLIQNYRLNKRPVHEAQSPDLYTTPTQPARAFFQTADKRYSLVHQVQAESSTNPGKLDIVLARGWLPDSNGAQMLTRSDNETKALAAANFNTPTGTEWRTGAMQVRVDRASGRGGVDTSFDEQTPFGTAKFWLQVGTYGDFVIDMRMQPKP